MSWRPVVVPPARNQVTVSQRKLLLLAFGPFGSWLENSTDQVSRAVFERLTEQGVAARREVLETRLATVRGLVDSLKGEVPRAVLACGLSGRSTGVQVERRARNLLDFSVPDVGGEQPRHEPVLAGAPQALLSEVNFPVLLEALKAAGVDASLSDDAGSYICNALYFLLLEALQGRSVPVVFLHLPPLPGLARADEKEHPTMALELQVRALLAAAEQLLAESPA